MESDFPVDIPFALIKDHFICSICLDTITNATITPCGHRYCKTCIEEVVDRGSRCPLCNQHVKQKQLVADKSTDEFLRLAEQERDRAAKKYMEKLFKQCRPDANPEENVVSALTPFEVILQKHMKNYLGVYEKHLASMRVLCQKQITLVNNKAEEDQKTLKSRDLPPALLERRLGEVVEECEQQKVLLNQQLDSVVGLLATSFDEKLALNLPDPNTLPVQVTLSVPSRNFRAQNITITAKDKCEDVVERLKQAMSDAGQDVDTIEDGYRLMLFGPFNLPGSANSQGGVSHAAASSAGNAGVVMATDCHLLANYCVKPNSEIQLLGTVNLKSELPKQCFATTYKVGDLSTVDYFTCKTCNYNWICQTCAEVCHAGHAVEAFIYNHIPQWACCYCRRKKKCTL